MNPLFTAHIVADFLFQPKSLVDWKQRRVSGVVIHALIHAFTMALFVLPVRLDISLFLLAIAALHGAIDQIKIHFQKIQKSFELPLFFDQLAHLIVLLAANYLFPYALPFWQSEPGKGISALLFIFSFAVAWPNISNVAGYPMKTRGARLKRLLLLAAVFVMFFLPSHLLSVSSCSWL